MCREAVGDRAHGVLTNAEVQVASGVASSAAGRPLRSPLASAPFWKSPIAASAVCVDGSRSAEPPTKPGSLRLMALRTLPDATRVAMPWDRRRSWGSRRPSPRQLRPDGLTVRTGELGLVAGVRRQPRVPGGLRQLAAVDRLTEVGEGIAGDVEGGLERPTQRSFGPFDLVRAQRRTVCFEGVLLVRGAVSDMGAHEDERRTVGLRACRAQGGSTASTSLPSSTVCVCQPYASKRLARSSLKVMSVGADSVMWLSSYR